MADEAVDLSEVGVKDGESVSRDDLAALLGSPDLTAPRELDELEKACAGGLRPNAVPCTIYLKDGNVFIVDDFRAWGYTPFGVFAIGRFEDDGESTERWRLFNGDEVASIEFDFDALEKANEEEPSGDEAAESTSD